MAETDDDDKSYVLCLATDLSPIPPIPGAMARKCSACGRGVWLSRATAAAVAGVDHELRCERCMPDIKPGVEVSPPTAGQLAEMPPELSETARRKMASPKARARMIRDVIRRARRGKL